LENNIQLKHPLINLENHKMILDNNNIVVNIENDVIIKEAK
jgi:hypothetical protein